MAKVTKTKKKVKKNIEIKINPATGKAQGFLLNKPKFTLSKSPKTIFPRYFSGETEISIFVSNSPLSCNRNNA